MALVSMKKMLSDAKSKKYAIGAFNVTSLESLQGILDAAVESKSPVIMNIAEVHFKYVDMEAMAPMIQRAAQLAPVPVALHLDHGLSLATIVRAVRCGFTSVMYDGSEYPLEENIRRTKQIVDICHSVGVTVEAELGQVVGAEHGGKGGASPDESLYTDPEEAVRFCGETGVDALAVSIGTVHGVFKGEPKLDFDRLAEIARKTDVPLVLHGGSGVSDADFRKAIQLGISKINFYTQTSIAAVNRVKQRIEREPDIISFPDLLLEAKSAIRDTVKHQMEVFGSAGMCNQPNTLCNGCSACRKASEQAASQCEIVSRAQSEISDEELVRIITQVAASVLRESRNV